MNTRMAHRGFGNAGHLVAQPQRAIVVGSGAVRRLDILWAWASLLVLIICWDAALRLDQRVPLPRMRIAHVSETDLVHADASRTEVMQD